MSLLIAARRTSVSVRFGGHRSLKVLMFSEHRLDQSTSDHSVRHPAVRSPKTGRRTLVLSI